MISPKDRRVFEFISGVIASNGEAPTIAEIQKQFNLSSSASAHAIVRRLETAKMITKVPHVSRGIRLVTQGANDECRRGEINRTSGPLG